MLKKILTMKLNICSFYLTQEIYQPCHSSSRLDKRLHESKLMKNALTLGMFEVCFDFCSSSSIREEALRIGILLNGIQLKYNKNT